MAKLFGRTYTKQELLSFTGNMAQLGGIRSVELSAGRERGVRGFELTTGTGFTATILADRALDITSASFRGRSLSYLTPSGQAHPAYFEPAGAGWLRTFSGGLVATCGMRNIGMPCVDEGEELGLPGRVGTLPMEELGHWTEWRGDEYWMYLKGSLTEGVVFGNPLRLTRQISARLGGNGLTIDDTVENMGGEPTPHLMLYHCNLGFPMLSPDAKLVTNSRKVTPRDAVAAAGLDKYAEFQPPAAGYTEQCFFHEMVADNAGKVRAALVNRMLDNGLGVCLSYHQKSLPNFIQWKMMGFGSYVLGMEPSNGLVGGRVSEREAGRLQMLQPGEQRTYHLEIGVLDGLDEIEEFERAIKFTA